MDTGRVSSFDERAYELWGVAKDQAAITFEILSKRIHPDDRERVRSGFAAALSVVGAYEIDFRVLIGDDIRWISARGQAADIDVADRLMFGVFLDVTQRKQAEEANELLAGEMSHRVINLLHIATALTHMTARSAATKEDMARELTDRLTALGRAQKLVRPAADRKGGGALLEDLVSVLLVPYDAKDASVRIRVSAPRIEVGEKSSMALALVIHELATNSAKYGAYRSPAGHWTCRAAPMTTMSSSSGQNAAARRSYRRRRRRASAAARSTAASPPNSAAPSPSTGRRRAWW